MTRRGPTVLAFTAFKETLSPREACAAVEDLVPRPLAIPVADGGDGTLDVLPGRWRSAVVTGPLGTPLRSALMESEISGVGAGAVSAALGAMAAEARGASVFGVPASIPQSPPAAEEPPTPVTQRSDAAPSAAEAGAPSEPASVVTSASAPGWSGIGTRSSTRAASVGMPDGRLRRAARARSSTSRRPPRSPSSTRARTEPSAATYSSSAATMASRLATQMSGQMPGWLAAMRVMSRNPPAASRRSSACAVPFVAATSMSVVAASCGTWLTTATRAS